MIKQFNTQLLQSIVVCCAYLILASCSPPLSAVIAERLIPHIVAKLPHELPAFTQGLAVEGDQLYESTGLYGQSSVRRLDILTGQVKQKQDLPSHFFAEGLAVFHNRIFQITWREQKAFLYDRQSFEVLKVLPYIGEGWGLCRDGQTVWMSNGTDRLVQRDSQTFDIVRTVDVHQGNRQIYFLNDLECDGTHLYANIYQTYWIVRIDKANGEVTGIIDASHLLSPEEYASLGTEDVLNGIAFRPQTGTFFLTGKGWPWIFEVRLQTAK